MTLSDIISYTCVVLAVIGAAYYIFEDHAKTMKSAKAHKEEIATRTTTFMLLGKEVSIVHRAHYDPHFVRELEAEVRDNGALTTCGKTDCATCHDEFLCVDDECKICHPAEPVKQAISTPNEERRRRDYSDITIDELLGIAMDRFPRPGSDEYRLSEQIESGLVSIEASYGVDSKNVRIAVNDSLDGKSYDITFNWRHPLTGGLMYMKGIVIKNNAFGQALPVVRHVPESTWRGAFTPDTTWRGADTEEVF